MDNSKKYTLIVVLGLLILGAVSFGAGLWLESGRLQKPLDFTAPTPTPLDEILSERGTFPCTDAQVFRSIESAEETDETVCAIYLYPNLKESLETITQFQRLMVLDARGGSLEDLTSDIGELVNLRVLSIADNASITDIPSEIGNLKQLEFLDIRGTNISSLPAEIMQLPNLKVLIIDAGKIPDSQLEDLRKANSALIIVEIPNSVD